MEGNSSQWAGLWAIHLALCFAWRERWSAVSHYSDSWAVADGLAHGQGLGTNKVGTLVTTKSGGKDMWTDLSEWALSMSAFVPMWVLLKEQLLKKRLSTIRRQYNMNARPANNRDETWTLIWLHFLKVVMKGTEICPSYDASASTSMCGFLKCPVYHDGVLHSISSDQEVTLEWKKYSDGFTPMEVIGLIHTASLHRSWPNIVIEWPVEHWL